jgi:PAS domain S-box-containing protein
MKNVKRTSKQLIMKVDEISRSLLENAPHPITAINPDTSIMYVNPAFEKLTGFSLPEIIGRQAPYPWWPEETRAKRLPALKKLLAGTNKTIEQTIQKNNGELFLVQLSMIRVVEKGIFKYHLAYCLDITERKRAEEALIENEEKYRMLVEDSLIGIMNVDLTGKITYVNNTIVHETGYSREELVGKNAFRLGLITREMIKVLRKRMKEKLTGQPPGLLQLQFKCKDGRWIWLQIRGKLIRKHNIPVGVQIIGEEITERKLAEATLRKSEEKYRVLHDTMAQGVAYQDKTGKVVSMNTAAERILGVQLEKITDVETINTNLITIHEDGSEYSAEQHPTMVSLRTGKPVKDAIMGIYHPQEDDYRWVIINTIPQFKPGEDKPYQVFVTFADITERKKSEEALKDSQESYHSLIGNANIGIIVIQDGQQILYNPTLYKMLEYTEEEYSKLDFISVIHPEDRALALERINERLRGIPATNSIELRAISKSGDIKWIETNSVKIQWNGKPAVQAFILDITERREAEEKLREAATLRELDRLRTELLANISHKLRTPLSSIKGFATVLLEYENKLKRAEKREYLETIDKNTDRLVELIEQLLDMSRLGAGMLPIEKSPTSISKLFQEVIAEVQVRAPAHRFTSDLPAKLPMAHVDARRIRQVLDNLTDNAVKNSRAGTEITIRARKKGDEILVAVIDQGTGIPENILPRVFERLFSSGKRHVSGTSGIGLGLSICKGLVEAHGGRIWIESEEGRGTTCFFTLPIYQRPGNDYGKKG